MISYAIGNIFLRFMLIFFEIKIINTISTVILIALIPLFIFNFASKKGSDWLVQWEKEDANLQQLPYELLIVNVSTIGIHFLTGVLLTIGVLLSVWI